MNEALENSQTHGFSPAGFLHKILQIEADEVKKKVRTSEAGEDLQAKALSYILEDTKNKNNVARINFHGKPIEYTYKQLRESILAVFLAFALHKGCHIRSHFIVTDAPDLIFINIDVPGDIMRIEVYESYVHGADTSTRNPIDETEEVKKLWESKGRTDYGEKASILVTIPNRKATMNLMKYAEEIGKRRWLIENIYLHTYNAAEDRHYYHIIDPKNPKNIGRIDFAHSTDSKYHY